MAASTLHATSKATTIPTKSPVKDGEPSPQRDPASAVNWQQQPQMSGRVDSFRLADHPGVSIENHLTGGSHVKATETIFHECSTPLLVATPFEIIHVVDGFCLACGAMLFG
jgi:hypothetical protein